MASSADVPLDLSIQFGTAADPWQLKRKEPSESIKQLGLKNNPAADYTGAIKDKSDISKAIMSRLKQSSISSKNAYHLYHNIWLPKMQCSLAATSFSKTACVKIMKPFVHAILPKMGFNRNTTHTIIYGSRKYGGFQLANLYIEQGYLAIKHLLGHLCKGTIT
eukprot:12548452-Ditylum_brightwellii.AAC.1